MRTIEEAELLVLRALCQGTPQGLVRAEAAKLLSGYAWRDPIHQAMFDCLAGIAAMEPQELRRILFICLTRRGFPDVDLEKFFGRSATPLDKARQSIERLIKPR